MSRARTWAAGAFSCLAAATAVLGLEAERADAQLYDAELVRDINPGTDTTFSPKNLAVMGGALYFTAGNATTGFELWRSDGTLNGTTLVKEFVSGSSGGDPSWLTAIGDVLYFSAADTVHGTELWRSDGTEGGTSLVKDIRNTTGIGSNPRFLTNVNGTLYFAAADTLSNEELWRSDGTEGGTTKVQEINPTGSSSPNAITPVGTNFFFVADDGTNGAELWFSNGTTATLAEVNTGPNGSDPQGLTALGGNLVFNANDAPSAGMGTGREPWRADGSTGAVAIIEDIGSGSGCSMGCGSPAGTAMARLGGHVYFAAQSGGDTELWRTDGTEGGTALVENLRDPGSSAPANFAATDGRLLFAAFGTGGEQELYASDGTPGGTGLLKDINPGTGSAGLGSGPTQLTAAGNRVFFRAFTAGEGRELWSSDGTPQGTALVKNINPGAGFADPEWLTPFGEGVAFTANDGATGRELWRTFESTGPPPNGGGDPPATTPIPSTQPRKKCRKGQKLKKGKCVKAKRKKKRRK